MLQLTFSFINMASRILKECSSIELKPTKKKAIILIIFALASSCNAPVQDSRQVDIMNEQPVRLPYFNSADFTPEWDNPEHKIPDFSFLNQNG